MKTAQLVDLIKQRKQKRLRHIRRMKDEQLVKTVMLGMVENG